SGGSSPETLCEVVLDLGAGAARRLFYLPGGVQRILRTAAPAQSFEHRPEQTASLCSKAYRGAKADHSNMRRLSEGKNRRRQIVGGSSAMLTAVRILIAVAPPS